MVESNGFIGRTSISIGGHPGVPDIAERTLMEMHLRQRTAYLDALLMHNPLGIIVLDNDNRIQMCNPAFEKIFLYSQEEILGLDVDDIVAQDGLREEVRELTRRTKSGAVVHAEATRARKDGTSVSVEIHSLPLVVEGSTVGSFAIYQDTTERRLAEESVKILSGRLLHIQDEERRRIARDLHDTTVQELAALAMKLGALSKSSQGALSTLEHAALLESMDLAEHCAQDLRTLSYLLYPPLLDEAGVGSAAKWYAEGFARRTGITMKLAISSKFPRLPHDIEMALFRILQEGLSNVYKHAGSRSVQIRLSKKGRHVHLDIADDGIGIPRAMLDLVNSTNNMVGMGIAGMRERVKQLAGQFEIRAIRGTTVHVTLPVPRGFHG